MIECEQFFLGLKQVGIDFFTGVPDSLLKHFCFYIDKVCDARAHVIAVNEGSAVALAAGHYVSTGQIPMVYMQNSGLGNAINPLVSLCDAGVYAVPMLLCIGWRGEPGTHDEPQHMRQGEITEALLKTLNIPYVILPREASEAQAVTRRLVDQAKQMQKPVAILVRKDTFLPCESKKMVSEQTLTREQAIATLIQAAPQDALFVCTTGKASRELYELRGEDLSHHKKDFLVVGSMGHASMIALKIALNQPNRLVVCLDGDGALLMHMGALSTIARLAPRNVVHVVLNNGVHESVGGQPTGAMQIDLPMLAGAVGYPCVYDIKNAKTLDAISKTCFSAQQLTFLSVQTNTASRSDLGRPKETLRALKTAFMTHIQDESSACSVLQPSENI